MFQKGLLLSLLQRIVKVLNDKTSGLLCALWGQLAFADLSYPDGILGGFNNVVEGVSRHFSSIVNVHLLIDIILFETKIQKI